MENRRAIAVGSHLGSFARHLRPQARTHSWCLGDLQELCVEACFIKIVRYGGQLGEGTRLARGEAPSQ